MKHGVDYLVYKDSLTCKFQFRRPALALKGAPIFRDAKFVITCKKVVNSIYLVLALKVSTAKLYCFTTEPYVHEQVAIAAIRTWKKN